MKRFALACCYAIMLVMPTMGAGCLLYVGVTTIQVWRYAVGVPNQTGIGTTFTAQLACQYKGEPSGPCATTFTETLFYWNASLKAWQQVAQYSSPASSMLCNDAFVATPGKQYWGGWPNGLYELVVQINQAGGGGREVANFNCQFNIP